MENSYKNKRWLVLIASCLVNLCIGSVYAWSVFAAPVAKHLSQINGLSGENALTAASVAVVFTVANAVGPLTMICGGVINQKLAPRWIVLFGGILFGLGVFASGFAKSIGMLVLCYGLGCGLGIGLVYSCTINNSIKFFPDKQGLVSGIATASYGLSSVIIPPIANSLIEAQGILSTFRILGVVMTLIICVASIFIDTCPEGYAPPGWSPKTPSGESLGENKTWKEMLKDKNFYMMFVMLLCGAFSGLMIISQASPMAQSMIHMSAGLAATCVSVLALFNALGRIVAGYISDKIGCINTLLLSACLSLLALGLLSLSGEGENVKFIFSIILIGVCFGSLMGVYPSFTAEQFGSKHNSINYGIMFVGFALAGILGPGAAQLALKAIGTYNSAILIAMVFGLGGIVMGIILRRSDKVIQVNGKSVNDVIFSVDDKQ